MRICVFAPDMDAFGPERLGRVQLPPSSTAERLFLTNSWGEAPPGAPEVQVTGRASSLPIRGCRRLLRDPRHARLAAPFAASVAGADLIEGFHAADPDVIVALDSAWIPTLRRVLRGHRPAWPCVAAGQPLPLQPSPWRRYDPGATVSIVLPTYNGTRYLAASLESCLAQTHRALQVVVVDDGSDAPIAEIVHRFADPRVLYLRHPHNRGLPGALNTGFAHATGAYLTWTSDDNRYAPNAIEELVRFLLTYPDVDFVYADCWEIDEAGRLRGRWRTRPPAFLSIDNRVGACFLYRRAVYETVGEYSSRAVLAEDYEYWVRVSRRFRMQRLFQPLYFYRAHPSSLTARAGRVEVVRQVQAIRKANRRWPPTGRRQAGAA